MNSKKEFHPRLFLLLNIIIGIVFVISSAVVIVSVNIIMRQYALKEAEIKANVLIEHNLASHAYFNQMLKPSLFELTDLIESEDYFDPVWMSSTYAIRETNKIFADLNVQNYYYKEAAINARSPENEASDYERLFIEKINANPDLKFQSDIIQIEEKPFFITLHRGEKMETSCLRCHSTPEEAPQGLVEIYGAERSFNRSVGEVISAISVQIPLDEAYADADRFSMQFSGLTILLLFFIFGIQFYLYRKYLLNPLNEMRTITMNIANNEEFLGEKIPLSLGYELNEMAHAINIMSVNLRKNRDQLEDRIQQRTKALQEANKHLKFLATHDSLTKLPNPVLFYDRLDQMLKFSSRNKQKFAILFIDLNDFKDVNDTHGHKSGDKVLQIIAERLTATQRETDTISRLGGDEFAVILGNMKNLRDISHVAEKVSSAISSLIEINNYEMSVTASIGISIYPDDSENSKTLLHNADLAMYEAKRTHKKVNFFNKGNFLELN
ncbi:MAG: diguanylate cyclase [Anaerolineaceae bacterium]|nr:diguanylate cyclase [Anaerolineaceae bacterium]